MNHPDSQLEDFQENELSDFINEDESGKELMDLFGEDNFKDLLSVIKKTFDENYSDEEELSNTSPRKKLNVDFD